ncbi:MAG TPA: DUF2179 domain-containing protein [Bacteroidales bacterium]|nr:DUF2179 domain-containing protein [Bacteroidales bacterium]
MDLYIVDTPLFTWVILPLLIFFARIMDQSIGTMRLIFVSRGMKFLAPFLGFFEVIIWLLAVGQIMQHLDNWLCYIAYGAGFAMGNYIGITIEERLSLGTSIIRLILPSPSPELIHMLQEQNFGLTLLDAEGSKGSVKVIFSIVRRKEIRNFIDTVNTFNPGAFYTIEDVRTVNEGIFRATASKSLFGSVGARLMKSK